MKKLLALVIASVIVTPVTGIAQTADEGILQKAERAAVGLDLRRDASDRRRSAGRTSLGIAMIGFGVMTSVQKPCVLRVEGTCLQKTEWYERAPGVALAVGGILLATVWSDVEALSAVDVAVAPDRVHVGKTWGF